MRPVKIAGQKDVQPFRRELTPRNGSSAIAGLDGQLRDYQISA
jgi:hypothetical protein